MLRLHKLASVVASVVVACVLVQAGDANAAPVRIPNFGSNPGNLDMFAYSPSSAGDDAPLVLVLHGCTQSAAAMQAGGFEPLADEFGFHLVFPQQKSANNPVSCFNWAGEFGDPANLVRGQGENQSIASMVAHMKATQSIDPDRVFIIGFSAGGGMTSVMLATWPDLFAGGAIASGIPYRCATDVTGAFDCQNMSIHPERKKTPAQWGDLVRNAFPGFSGPRPRVFIMHGTMDFIVHSDAGIELVDQWTNVNGVDIVPEDVDTVGIAQRSRHRDANGTIVVESWRLNGMGHAFPVGQDPERTCGTVAAFFEDRDICGAFRALDFFGVTSEGGGGEPDAGVPDAGVPDAGMPVDAACGVDAASAAKEDQLEQDVDVDPEATGCAAGGSSAGFFYVLLALALVSARRRRAARSSLPAPVRGSSGKSS